MHTRDRRLWIARLTLALLFFAQGAMAWSACDWLENSPARAVLAAAEAAPCHESPNASVCLTHCLSDRQADQKAGIDVPAQLPTPALSVLLPVEVFLAGLLPQSDSRPATGPPRRILLQSYQV
jgi:hypothetical protein